MATTRTRRQRYIEAIDPIRRKYNCTAAEVSGVFNKLESDLHNTKQKLDALHADVRFVLNSDKADIEKVATIQDILNK